MVVKDDGKYSKFHAGRGGEGRAPGFFLLGQFAVVCHTQCQPKDIAHKTAG